MEFESSCRVLATQTAQEALERQHAVEERLPEFLVEQVPPDEDGQEQPVFYDTFFHQKRKGGKWRTLTVPELGWPTVDTHAHLHMLPTPGLSLARAGIHGLVFVCAITDPTEDGTVVFDNLKRWEKQGTMFIPRLFSRC